MSKKENQVSTIIAKVNGRNKVLDFRDGLVVANVNDYAMLHGCGGEGHAPSSVIKVYLCDYSSGTGSMSRTVSANISTVLCEQIFEVCKRNIGAQIIPDDFGFFTEQRMSNKKMSRMADMCHCALQGSQIILDRFIEKSKEGDSPKMAAVAERLSYYLKKALERAAAEPASPEREPYMGLPQHMDFNYSQDRVHNYQSKTGGGNIAPVQKLEIWHTTYRKQGDLSTYPWTVRITNGKARVVSQPTGGTTYDASSMTDVEKAFIQISDADMFRAMSRINHYVNVWENAIAVDVVRQGLIKREQERKAFIAQRESEQYAEADGDGDEEPGKGQMQKQTA